VILYFFHTQNLLGDRRNIRFLSMDVNHAFQADAIRNASDNKRRHGKIRIREQSASNSGFNGMWLT
jgi:hypothetical protein